MTFSEFYEQNKARFLDEFKEFLRIRSISADSKCEPEIKKAQKWLKAKLEKMGFVNIKLLQQESKEGNEVLVAQRIFNKEGKTILVYGHYDVQPVEPLDEWRTDPFEPEINNGRIYGRGANDNKGQIMANLIALEYYIAQVKSHKYNIKIFFEGEEETGGATTEAILKEHRYDEFINSDYAYIADTTWISEDKPTVIYALRGILYYDLILQNAAFDSHSGTYGNLIMNPANLIGRIIFKLKDVLRNRVRIPKFYKDVRRSSNAEIEQINAVSSTWQEIRDEVNAECTTPYLRKGETFSPLSLRGLRPSLDIHGIASGYSEIGGIKTIIPAKATAKFSVRLVANQKCKEIDKLIRKYISKLIPKGIKYELNLLASAEPYIMEPNEPILQEFVESYNTVCGENTVLVPEGGSIGLVNTLADEYNIRTIITGYGLPDDKLHSPNEKFDLRQLEVGANVLYKFLTYKNG